MIVNWNKLVNEGLCDTVAFENRHDGHGEISEGIWKRLPQANPGST